MKRAALRLGLLLCGLGILAGLIWQADPGLVWTQLRGLGPGAALFLLPSLGTYTLDALAWRLCFRTDPNVSWRRLFLIRMAGESLNNTLPSAYLGGEPLKVYLLQRAGVAGPEALASVIVGKTALIVSQALFVLAGVGCAAWAAWGAWWAWGAEAHEALPALIAGGAATALLFALCMGIAYAGQRYGLGRALRPLSARTGLGAGFVARQASALERLDQSLGDYYREDARAFWLATALFLGGWSCEVLEIIAFCQLSGLPQTVAVLVALGALATVVKAAGFFLPGSVGAQEGGNVLLFLAFGLSAADALVYSILRRARELCWIGFGFGAAWLLGWTPAGLAAPGGPEAPSQGEPGEESASPLGPYNPAP